MRRMISVVLVAGVLVGLPDAAQAAAGHARIAGTGASGAGPAMQQWAADVARQGLDVGFTPTGASSAIADFAAYANDFTVTGTTLGAVARPYTAVPLAGGGTALPYRLFIGGRQVRDLRLSGPTIAKIFTNQITDWSDPAITADNNGRRFPALPIVPVLHSEGADETWQFTSYLAGRYPLLWGPFNGGSPVPAEYFPRHGAAVAVNGSDAVADLLSRPEGNGAIAYNAYAYALQRDEPVAAVRNEAGYYVPPTGFNVAVALRQAQFDLVPGSPDYLMQVLAGVYVNADARAYPLSSYLYAIVPTAGFDPRLTSQQRQTLADFLGYALCGGQRSMDVTGYTPLPTNLVLGGYQQLRQLADADPAVTVPAAHPETCGNPAYSAASPDRNTLAEVAPMPPACAREGQGPCLAGPGPGSVTEVPADAANDTPPYTGAVSLQITGGTAVHLTQVDPGTAAGHPAQGTDPTGHRHAWVFTGGLGGVSVDDSRPDVPGWTLTGQATDFVNGATTVPARHLGWTPALVVPGSDAEGTPVAGPQARPALWQPSSTGLAEPGTVLARAPAGSGLGVQKVAADLVLWMPDTAPKGTYTATLTLTLISA